MTEDAAQFPLNDKSHDKGLGSSSTDIRVDSLCEGFEKEWKQGNNPAIKTFLVDLDKPTRLPAFRKLLRKELELRHAQGKVPARSEYQAQFPDYQEDIEQAFALLEPSEEETIYTKAVTSTLKVRCPNCQNPVDVLPETELHEIFCQSCDSSFGIWGEGDGEDLGGDHGKQFAQFTLTEQLGVGAFGTVWKAIDTRLDRTVAIKIPRKSQLNSKESEMFLREARAAAQLKHPNIVGVHEIGREDDRIYIVSDYVQGGSLAERLQGGPLTSREAAELCEKIANALEHAHRQGVIHRDLKPANILLDTSGNPLIADFGLAKREAGEITMTQDGQVLGTPAYMSPEQAQGDVRWS